MDDRRRALAQLVLLGTEMKIYTHTLFTERPFQTVSAGLSLEDARCTTLVRFGIQ